MRSTGIVRKVDELGRIVIPMEMRKVHGINNGDAMEFFVEGDTIVLRRYAPGCAFCGEVGELSAVLGKQVCHNCRAALRRE